MWKLSKFLILLMSAGLIMGSSNAFLSLDKIISDFGWEKRVVLLIAEDEDIKLIRGVDEFFKEEACQNNNRNLELYKIIGDDIKKYKIPRRYKGKRGIWLIGYDGSDKAYSRDLFLLNQLYEIIDKMPIRQNEMVYQDTKCD